MTGVLVLVAAWVFVAVAVALLVGRTVHTADVIEHTEEAAGLTAVVVPVPPRALADC